MTHFGSVPGKFVSNSLPTDNPKFKCRCGSNDITFRLWESDCGGYDDTCYKCNACGKIWWVEGPDA